MVINILASALGFFLGSRILEGVKQNNFLTSVIIAVVVAVLSVTLGSFLKIVSLGILTFGLFTLLLDAILILIADWFIKDFEVKNFWWALILAFIVSCTESVVRVIM